jgi:hypothetical protein
VTITLPIAVSADTDFTIKFEGCKNPKDLVNTGPFKVYTRKTNDLRNSAENWTFASLSFTQRYSTYTAITDTSQAEFSNLVYAETPYFFNIKLQTDIDAGTWFRLELPTGWSKLSTDNDTGCQILSYDSNLAAPAGNYKCRTEGTKYVFLEGLGEPLLKSKADRANILLKFDKIRNPGYTVANNSVDFKIDIFHEGTPNIIEQYSSKNTAIVPGTLVIDEDDGTATTGAAIITANKVLYNFVFVT